MSVTWETSLQGHTNIVKFLRVAFPSSGVAVLIGALLSPRFRGAEGFLEGDFCLPLSIGVALVVLGWAIAGRYRKFAFWFALAIAGQAAALQLIEAGPYVRYQRYRDLHLILTETHPVALAVLLFQIVAVIGGLKVRWPVIRNWIGRCFRVWQLLGLGLALFVSGAAVSRQASEYATDLVLSALVQALNLGTIVLTVWALPEAVLPRWKQIFEGWFGRFRNEGAEKSARIDRFALLAATWVVALSSILCLLSYQGCPHIPDEVMYLYQARYFASGSLTVPAPPVPEAFRFYLIPHESHRWYSIFPPGWPLVLALGVLVGVPWLVNPLLAGLNILLAYVLIHKVSDRHKARMAVFLLCVSPWYIFMAMSFMSHTFTLTCALAAALCVNEARESGRAIWGGLGGMAIGMASLIRPLDGLIVAGILGLWAVGVGGHRLRIASIVALVAGAFVVGATTFVYNEQITGDATTFPLTAYYEKYFGHKSNALGFGPERGLGWAHDPFPGHSPIDALVNANLNTSATSTELFGWSTGSLFLIALLLFTKHKRKGDYLMLLVICLVASTYSLYWFGGGPDFGARYWYLMIVPLVLLTVSGIQKLQGDSEPKTSGLRLDSTRVTMAYCSLSLISLVTFFPWRAIDKYHHYRGRRPDIASLAEDYGFGRSLVLVHGDDSDYLSAMIYNPIDPFADVPVYAWNRNPKVEAALLEAYADRPVWIVDGPSITHGPFKVVDGPLLASQVSEATSDGDRL